MKTIEQCKDEAAQELWAKTWQEYVDGISDYSGPSDIVTRAMEIYAASALSSVREKLPALRHDVRKVWGECGMERDEDGEWLPEKEVKELLK